MRRSAALVLLLGLACQTAAREQEQPERRPATTDVTAEDFVAPELPRARVLLQDAFGGTHRVEAEVAATPGARQRGLMWRRELPAGTGMLFIFPTESVQSFWMKNTLIPLDMLFISEAGEVVGVVPNAQPHTLTGRSVGEPSRYVLEVPAGWTEAKGIQPGSRVRFEGLGAVQVQ